MRFGVLGAVEVRTEAGEPVRVPELKVRLLLAHLLVHADETVPLDALIERLWGERTPADPKASLQAKVSQLRRVLDDAEPGARELVVSGARGYRLAVPEAELDSGRFASLLERARAEADPRARAVSLDDALALWRGPAFADVEDSLAARPVITRLRDLWLVAVEDRAEVLLELGEHVLVAGELEQLLAEHPLRERLRAAQMRALYLADRPTEALAVFEELRARLRDEVGADPGPQLMALHQAVLRHSSELRPAPPARPVARTLPAPLTELVGRADDIDRVHELVHTGRLVTLVGPGGVGKTRLALAMAHELEGVWFVELDALPASGGDTGATGAVADAVCQAFGAKAGGHSGASADPVSLLLDTVGGVAGVLVLDNAEHVVGGVAALVPPLLAAAPDLRLLVTSREPLDVGGELIHAVEPLSPEASVELFASRASAADPGFVLDERTTEQAHAICARLDGLPLALELAAARVRGLGTSELAQRLDDRFAVLAGRRRDTPARQRTLRAVLDWSWDLLTGTERAVLRRLSVFSGGCTLDAAERVCADESAVDGVRVVDALARLVERSLVVRTASGRYRLLESVAAYAGERLADSGEGSAVRRGHVAYFLALAERAAPHLRGREQRVWLERLDADVANLRAVPAHAGVTDALRLADALAWYRFLRGRQGESVAAADSALAREGGPARLRAVVRVWRAGTARWLTRDALPGDDEELLSAFAPGSPELARASWFLAFSSVGFGDAEVACGYLRVALRTFRELGDDWGCAATLVTSARYAALRDDLSAVERDAGRAEDLFTELGDRWGRLQALDVLAGVAEVTGDYAEAARNHASALRIAQDLALWTEIAVRFAGLGRVMLLTGDLESAHAQHERARVLAVEQGNSSLAAYAEFGLALVARRRGHLAEAEELLARWLEPAAVHTFAALTPLAELGFIAELRGDGERARELHETGYRGALATGGGPRVLALALEGLAGAWSLLGEPERAARLLGAADAARGSVGAPLPPAERGDVDRIAERVRALLGEQAFAAAFADGARHAPDDPNLPGAPAQLR
ncbi:BTAD domain-containing putative transcriptional regulator [Prauserella cavernicola]|uniref:Winged helix-turn-helix domain-containing protein n=1 Tax=Prauserella cavernicola TaxID=2800127 RepID=A0A934V5D9_9PSEU|nr:BTAD domain-containing putative transcriptional regulator [Prauserella cavernicola]MBK1786387.1 winged helix-turn-helix domain-containing protein [Prauserella cavernicola]